MKKAVSVIIAVIGTLLAVAFAPTSQQPPAGKVFELDPILNGWDAEASPEIMSPIVKELLFNQNQSIPVLMYHEVVQFGQEIIHPELVVTDAEFKEQMRYLKDRGYTTMFLRDLYSYLADKKPLPEKTIVVTFDDGYKSFYELVYPILKELSIRASVAVVTKPMHDTLGNHFISWKQAKEMVDSGLVEVVSHSNTHVRLDSLSPVRLSEEMRVSEETIAKHLGRKSNIIVYPFGGYNDKVIQSAKKECLLGVTTKDGVNKYGADPFIIQRCRVSHGDQGEEIGKHLMSHEVAPLLSNKDGDSAGLVKIQ